MGFMNVYFKTKFRNLASVKKWRCVVRKELKQMHLGSEFWDCFGSLAL